MTKVAVYLSGGIAAYKSILLVRLLQKNGYQVKVAMTKAAQEFIPARTFATLLKEPVLTETFAKDETIIPHLELADWADYSLVVPATANLISKMANGIADDLVSTALLATATPKFVVPAMNSKMYLAPSTQRNLQTLIADGCLVLDPAVGMLAEGYAGIGRMPEPDDIFAWFTAQINKTLELAGKTVLITAGGTQEPIDPVRYLTNRSSGKMGFALARQALKLGAKVILITTKPCPLTAEQLTVINVQAACQMQAAVQKYFAGSDIVIMAAAVADYRVKAISEQKIKKHGETLTLELVKNPDILAQLGQQKTKQFLVGFAAETENLLKHAREKMLRKRVDLLVANDVSRADIGFDQNENEVILLQPDQAPISVPKTSKDLIAQTILQLIARKIQA